MKTANEWMENECTLNECATMYPKSISNSNLVVVGEEKYFNIFSKAINRGCLPDDCKDVVPCFNTAILQCPKSI